VAESDTVATTRKGKQLLNLADGAEMVVARPSEHAPSDKNYVAAVSSARKLLIFPAADVPLMTRGKGVILLRSAKGQLTDAKLFSPSEGFTWFDRAGREQSEPKWRDWTGKRGGAGSAVPKGFPRNLKLGSDV
jgi:topoisomerase-4 subunit A